MRERARFLKVPGLALKIFGWPHSCPFRKRSVPFFDPLLKSFLFSKKERKSQPRVEPGPRTQTFRILISPYYYITTPTYQNSEKLSTYTSNLAFLTVTSITGDPSAFHNLVTYIQLGLQLRSFQEYSKMYYFPYCNLIQGIYYTHHD